MKKSIILLLIIISLFSFKNNINALSNIKIEYGELVPNFQKNLKTYNIFLDENIETLSIICVKEDDDIEVNCNEKIFLNKGLNQEKIKVIKNNGKEITYTLNINRGEIIDDKDNAYLSNLNLIGYEIDFYKDKFNYEINIDENIDEVLINYELESSVAYATMTGGINLNKSENYITIKVTSNNKKNTNTYIIKLNKVIKTFKEKEVEKNFFGKENLTKKEKIVIISVISIISLLTILIFYLLIFKISKKLNILPHILRK